jgi:hypothetical protein
VSETARKRIARLTRHRDNTESELRQQQHNAVLMARKKEKQAERAGMGLGLRISRALAEATTLGGTPAVSLGGRVSRGKASSSPPPGASNLSTGEGNVKDHYERKFRLLVESLEREIDEQKVRPVGAARVTESSDEKDARLVRDFEGMDPVEVAYLDPSMGSTRSVERARVRMGRNPFTGRKP